MKVYGLRAGDGVSSHRNCGRNKFDRRKDEGGPRGKHKAAKVHRERRLVHKQARQDAKRELRLEMDAHG